MGVWTDEPIQSIEELHLCVYFKRVAEKYIEQGGSNAYGEEMNQALLREARNIVVRLDKKIDEYPAKSK